MTNTDLPDVSSNATDPEAAVLPVVEASGVEATGLEPADAAQAPASTPAREGNGRVEEADIAIAPSHAPAGVDGPMAPRAPEDGAAAEADPPSVVAVIATLDLEPEETEAELAFQRQLHPLPRGLVELYGLLAVLFVLVPEWMAGGALFGFREGRQGSELPAPSGAWKRLPELRLASLNLAELRLLAQESGLRGYGRQNREELTARLLRRLRARA